MVINSKTGFVDILHSVKKYKAEIGIEEFEQGNDMKPREFSYHITKRKGSH